MNDQNLDRILDSQDKKVVLDFLNDIVNPEVYGWACTEELRAKAYMLLILLGDRK